MPTVLHAGCGGDPLPVWFAGFDEVRLDINPDCNPDIVASMTSLGDIGPFDAIYCSHALEHLFPHDAATALTEFVRVLAPGGQALIFVPDLEDVKPTQEVLYQSVSGPITGHDLFYGYAPYLEINPYMAHRAGFVADSMTAALNAAGFSSSLVKRLQHHNLMAVATK